jgi:DNA-binding transcriptional MerR regulator
MVDESILSYIKDSLSKGYSKDSIKEILLKEGHSEQEIDEAISGLSLEPKIEEFGGNANLEDDLKLGFEKKKELKNVIAQKMPELQHQQTSIDEKYQEIEQQKEQSSEQNNNTEYNEQSSENITQNQDNIEIPKGKLGEYDKDKRPPRHVLHLSMKNLANTLDSHNKILLFGAIALFLIIIALVGTVLFMFMELKSNYDRQAINAPKADVAICGYCEYFFRRGLC